MSAQIVVSVDDDGTLLIAVPPALLPLADMVARALQGTRSPALVADGAPEDEPAPQPKRAPRAVSSTADVDALAGDDEGGETFHGLQHRILKHLRAHPDGAAPRDVAKALKSKPDSVKYALSQMASAGTLTAEGATISRKYKVAA